MDARRPEFPLKDVPLRDDVRQVGEIVGLVIAEQCGPEMFARVERVRRAAIRYREGSAGGADLEGELARAAPDDARTLVRAFSSYFQAVNIAERVHRIRRSRAYGVGTADGPQARSLYDIVGRLRRAGETSAGIQSLLRSLSVEPVFTAHPSEATRRSLLDKHRRIANQLLGAVDDAGSPGSPQERVARIRTEITAAWQTGDHSDQRPRVEDELNHVLFHITNVLYPMVPDLYEELEHALELEYGPEDASAIDVPTILRFGSWVGGDMDGNPNVGAQTIHASLTQQRSLIIELYRGELDGLYSRLSQSVSRIGVSEPLRGRITAYASRFRGVREAMPVRHLEMPYRVLLRLMAARLEATLVDSRDRYASPDEFLADLRLIADSLTQNQGAWAGLGAVRRAIRRVDTFGFHLATLDIRQNSARHRLAVGAGLSIPEWETVPAARRETQLLQSLDAARRASTPPSLPDLPDLHESLAVFRSIFECQRRFGEGSVRTYIVSMTQDSDDLLSVLLLARWAGLGSSDAEVPLDVVPLFETGDDLDRAPEVLARLLSTPLYRSHLASRGNHQMVMVGYSDSNKDAGFFASRWMIQNAQKEIASALDRFGIDLTVFHGRGGTAGRGGGKTYQGVLASPPGAVRGRFRVTEQGEIISERYGLRSIARRNLEQAIGATILATARHHPGGLPDSWVKAAEAIGAESRKAYRSLVLEEPGFFEYFRGSTPIDVIERMKIGSRPARRSDATGIGDLRAIPWVFAWTQSRQLIPGWYGLGSGLESAIDRYGEEALSEMVREWIFLQSVVADSEMALAKADMAIAARYADLAGSQHRGIFERIRSEYARTVDLVVGLKGTTSLLDEEPALRRSIYLRNPYVDPISLIQVDLLRQWRERGRPDDDAFQALLETVGGIALGLQNTG